MEEFYWPLMENAIGEEEINSLINFLKSTNKYTKGEKTREFEQKWSEWQGCKYSIFVNSGSSANLILIDALKELYGWRDKDKIIVPTITWATNVSPIIQNNLFPIFVDVSLKNLSLDIDCLRKEIEKQDNIVGIFITHLLGIPAEIEKIKELCIEKEIKIFEDCCEATGAIKNWKKVGNFGEGSTFSFYFGHHMTTIEGGMICTNNKELYNLLLLKRSHGLARELPEEEFEKIKNKYPEINNKFLFLTHGYNFRNTEIAAVIGLEQLRKLDGIIIKRNKNFEKYYKICEENSEILYLIENKGVSSFSLPFIFKDKKYLDSFKKLLEKEKIECRPIISGNLLKQPFLSEYSGFNDIFPNTDIIHYNGLYIGNNQFIEEDKLDKMKILLNELDYACNNNFWKKKKVLVTGAGGFIGSYVIDIHVEKGAEVYANLRNQNSNHNF